MSLEQWHKVNQWLQLSEATVPEIQLLIEVVERDLDDAKVENLSADGKFAHAYDAALQLCMIPLRASGYKVKKGTGHHKKGIESLPLTMGEELKDTSDYIERCSRKRGQSIYERVGVVSEGDAQDLIEAVEKLKMEVMKWLNKNHPELLVEK